MVTSPPVAIADDASSSFINTAKMDRAALNGSLDCFLFVAGKDIPNLSFVCSQDIQQEVSAVLCSSFVLFEWLVNESLIYRRGEMNSANIMTINHAITV